MAEQACNSMEDEPGPIQWRCNRKPHDDKVHAFVLCGTTHHEWTDQ